MDRALILLTKEPAAGRVKTRLASEIGRRGALDLAWALLEDSLSVAADAASLVGARLVLAHDPEAIGPRLRALAGALGAALRPQPQGGLGARLAALLADEEEQRVALGSDAPEVPAEVVAQAFGRLGEGAPWVLGPSLDGGFYLVGLDRGVPAEALADPALRWSSETTLADLVAALARRGRPAPCLLPAFGDVDRPGDLVRLRASAARAPATRAWLAARDLGPAGDGTA